MSAMWLRRVLSLAPHSFRVRYGEELVSTYVARERVAAEEGRLFVFRVRELLGAMRLVVATRIGSDPGSIMGRRRQDPPSHRGATVQDARFALRSLRRNPTFSAAAVGVLGIGIGATSAIFSAVNAYLFRPLPFAEPSGLVMLYETNPEFGWDDAQAAPANLLDWQEQVSAFADVSGYLEFTDELPVVRDGEALVVIGQRVMGNFFSTLGVQAALGRSLRPQETWLGQDAVVVLSHAFWASHFGGDPAVVGQRIDFGNHSSEIVGVMPPGFAFSDGEVQLWYPMGWDPADRGEVFFRRAHLVRAFARLGQDVSPEQAAAELQVVVERLQQAYPATNSVMGAGMQPMRDFLVKDVRAPLNVLFGAAVFLLLLACTNVANLVLVRASERTREVALRRTLGASRARILRQMLVESSLLAIFGGVAGLGLGWLALRALTASTRVGIGGATTVALDHRVVLFTMGAAALSGILFGVAPALRGAVAEGGSAMPEGARGSTAGSRSLRTAGLLVSLQVGLALLLVVGAGLMVRSVWFLRHVDPGFRTEGVLGVQFALQDVRYPTRDDVLAFYDRFAEALEARGGVERVGSVGRLPLDGTSWSSQFQADGWPPERVGFEILHRRADRGYFEALGVPLVAGRMFDRSDGPGQPLVVLINETFAREHFPDEDPIGQRIAYDRAAGPRSTWYEIIGIVGDQHQQSLATPPRAEVFEHRSQDWARNVWHVIRGDGNAVDYVPLVREVLRDLDPLIPLARIRPLADVRDESLAREQLVLSLLLAFGLVALLLAVVGVYSVTSRAARRRTREIGIRMALGARADDVVRMMLVQGLRVVSAGLVAGVAAALVATRALSSLLFGVEPTDPATLAAVVALLGGVALLACYLPARRATTGDPVTSLKLE
jgi:putative ABC transport system permease protein